MQRAIPFVGAPVSVPKVLPFRPILPHLTVLTLNEHELSTITPARPPPGWRPLQIDWIERTLARRLASIGAHATVASASAGAAVAVSLSDLADAVDALRQEVCAHVFLEKLASACPGSRGGVSDVG